MCNKLFKRKQAFINTLFRVYSNRELEYGAFEKIPQKPFERLEEKKMQRKQINILDHTQLNRAIFPYDCFVGRERLSLTTYLIEVKGGYK